MIAIIYHYHFVSLTLKAESRTHCKHWKESLSPRVVLNPCTACYNWCTSNRITRTEHFNYTLGVNDIEYHGIDLVEKSGLTK